jgi:hypothetical protein
MGAVGLGVEVLMLRGRLRVRVDLRVDDRLARLLFVCGVVFELELVVGANAVAIGICFCSIVMD